MAIRQMLVMGLKESISKVRSSIAYAISAIATWDWPDAWPDLFRTLMQALGSGNPDLVHGAMRVLTGWLFKRINDFNTLLEYELKIIIVTIIL